MRSASAATQVAEIPDDDLREMGDDIVECMSEWRDNDDGSISTHVGGDIGGAVTIEQLKDHFFRHRKPCRFLALQLRQRETLHRRTPRNFR